MEMGAYPGKWEPIGWLQWCKDHVCCQEEVKFKSLDSATAMMEKKVCYIGLMIVHPIDTCHISTSLIYLTESGFVFQWRESAEIDQNQPEEPMDEKSIEMEYFEQFPQWETFVFIRK